MPTPDKGTRPPTKLTRKERQMVELLCRLARAARLALDPADYSGSLQAFFDAEYAVRLHWRIRR